LREDLERVRKENGEMEIVVRELSERVEMLELLIDERGLVAVDEDGGIVLNDKEEVRNLPSSEVEELRVRVDGQQEYIEELEDQAKKLKVRVSELKGVCRRMQEVEFEKLGSVSG